MNRKGISLLAGAGAAALMAGLAQAQDAGDGAAAPRRASDIADTVVVIGTRTERDIANVPAQISVITQEEIEDIIATDIKDLVRFEPGVSVSNAPSRPSAAGSATGRSRNSGFTIRGLGGDRVLIQTDGIRVPDSFSFGPQSVGRGDYVDLGLLESVEILRGPASALYGSDGLAGVVSFRTKDPDGFLEGDEAFGGRVRGAYASADDSLAGGAVVAGRSGALSGLLAYTHRDAHEQDNQGEIETQDSTRTAPNPADLTSDAVMGKIVYAPNDTHRLRLTGEVFDSSFESEVYSARETSMFTGATTDDLDVRDDTERQRVSLDYAYSNEGAAIDAASFAVFFQDAQTRQFSDEKRTPQADRIRIGTFDNRVWGATGQVETAFATGMVDHRMLFGGDWSETRQEGVRDGTVPPFGESFPTRAFPTTDWTLFGLLVQDEISIADGRLFLYPALRYDSYELTPDPDPLFPYSSSSQEGDRVSPKFGAVAWLTDSFGVFANYAEGFKAPSPDQVNNGFENLAFGYTSLPNPDLGPETSQSFEGGVRLRNLQAGGATWSASATAFTAEYEDFIQQTVVGGSFTPADPAIYQWVNLGEVEISGAEARAEASWDNGIGFIAAASYADGDATDAGTTEPLQSIDPFKLVAGLTYDDPAGRFGGQFIVTHSAGKDDDEVAENQSGNAAADLFTPDDFTILDITAYWNVTEAAALRVAVNNVLDEKYWWWSDVRGVGATSTILDAYTQPGRNFSASLVYRF